MVWCILLVLIYWSIIYLFTKKVFNRIYSDINNAKKDYRNLKSVYVIFTIILLVLNIIFIKGSFIILNDVIHDLNIVNYYFPIKSFLQSTFLISFFYVLAINITCYQILKHSQKVLSINLLIKKQVKESVEDDKEEKEEVELKEEQVNTKKLFSPIPILLMFAISIIMSFCLFHIRVDQVNLLQLFLVITTFYAIVTVIIGFIISRPFAVIECFFESFYTYVPYSLTFLIIYWVYQIKVNLKINIETYAYIYILNILVILLIFIIGMALVYLYSKKLVKKQISTEVFINFNLTYIIYSMIYTWFFMLYRLKYNMEFHNELFDLSKNYISSLLYIFAIILIFLLISILIGNFYATIVKNRDWDFVNNDKFISKYRLTKYIIIICTVLFLGVMIVGNSNVTESLGTALEFKIPDISYDGETLDLSDTSLENLQLFDNYNVEGVKTLNVNNTELTNLEGIENFSSLTTLYARNTKVNNIDNNKNDTIKSMYLSSVPYVDIAFNNNTFPNLETLEISRASSFSGNNLPSLTYLSIESYYPFDYTKDNNDLSALKVFELSDANHVNLDGLSELESFVFSDVDNVFLGDLPSLKAIYNKDSFREVDFLSTLETDNKDLTVKRIDEIAGDYRNYDTYNNASLSKVDFSITGSTNIMLGVNTLISNDKFSVGIFDDMCFICSASPYQIKILNNSEDKLYFQIEGDDYSLNKGEDIEIDIIQNYSEEIKDNTLSLSIDGNPYTITYLG